MSFTARTSLVLLLTSCTTEPLAPCVEYQTRYVTRTKQVAQYTVALQEEVLICMRRDDEWQR